MWYDAPLNIDPAMAAFVFATTAAPGPNAALMLAVGARNGVRVGLTILLGMAFANFAVKTLAAASLQNMVALDALPVELLKWPALGLCAWMAWRILRRGGLRAGSAPHDSKASFARLWVGFAFQCANPKVWVTSFTAAMLFAVPDVPLASVGASAGEAGVPSAIAFGLIGMIAVMIGAGAFLVIGASNAKHLSGRRATRALDLCVAAALGLAVTPVLFA